MMEIIRFAAAALFLVPGIFILGIATLGFFRLNSPLNRLHVAAKCDTLGALMVLIGLMIVSGSFFIILKLFLLCIFIWVTNPLAVYMIGYAEVQVDPDIEAQCEVIEL